MTTPEIVSAIKDVLVGSAAAITGTVAIFGYNSWRRELTGKAQFEIGRELLKATYRLRDKIKQCRSPFISAAEFPETYGGALKKHNPEEETQAYAHVYKNRWAPVWDALQEFDTFTIEAEAIWGADIRKRTDELRDCVKDLSISIEAFLSNKASGGEDFKADRDFGKMIQGKISAKSNAEDELSKSILKAVQDIESKVQPLISRS